MTQLFEFGLHPCPLPALILLIVVQIIVLGKGADMLVDEAVRLSTHWGIPKLLIGATVISLGTTTPEAVVSVMAAFKGEPDIALGNAVGSIICDTGLVLGLAALMAPLPLDRSIVNRQGWFQLAAGLLLVMACLPILSIQVVFEHGGVLPQFMGVVFLVLLAAYLWVSIRWTRSESSSAEIERSLALSQPIGVELYFKLLIGISLVLAASHFLIPTVIETALRLSVPEGIVSATLVAFGTSLPELVTAIAAVRKNHGELAVGNVIGADILNVLFVAGAAASVTRSGLIAPPHFFQILFPAMILVLFIFRAGIFFSGATLKRPFGVLLIATYLSVTYLSYAHAVIR